MERTKSDGHDPSAPPRPGFIRDRRGAPLREDVVRERERRPEDLVVLEPQQLAVRVEVKDGMLAVDDEAGDVVLDRVAARPREVAAAVVAVRRQELEPLGVLGAQRRRDRVAVRERVDAHAIDVVHAKDERGDAVRRDGRVRVLIQPLRRVVADGRGVRAADDAPVRLVARRFLLEAA